MNPIGSLDDSDATLIQLRAWLARHDHAPQTRLPPERELSADLGVTRGELRKALLALEREGMIWRHVGKGTFIGSRPLEDVMSLSAIEQKTNPPEVMRTRLMLEPALARDAALHASQRDLAEMQACLARMRRSESWRHYEAQDNALHRSIAKAADNSLALALFDALNAVRRNVVWTRSRQHSTAPPTDHHSFNEHEAIVRAIRERDPSGAATAMQAHLRTVQERLLDPG